MISDVTKSNARAGADVCKLVCLLGILFVNQAAFSQQATLDSLRTVLKHTPPNNNAYDTNRVSALYEILYYAPQQECFGYNREIIVLSEKSVKKLKSGTPLWKRYLFFLADAYYNEGVFYTDKMSPDSGMLFYRKSMAVNQLLGNQHVIAYTEVEIAKSLTTQGNYPEAIELLYNSLAIFEKMKDLEGEGDVYKAIGRMQYMQRNHDEALQALQKAYAVYEKIKVKKEMVDALFNISVVYSEKKNYVESVNSVKKSIKLMDELGEVAQQRGLQTLYMYQGMMYLKEKDMDKAIPFFEKSIELAKVSGNVAALGNRYVNLGGAYLYKKNYAKALQYATEALNNGRESGNEDSERSAAQLLYQIYKKTGNYKEALKMHELHMLLTDSIERSEVDKKVIEKQFKYDYEKKELLAKANQEKKINNLTIEAELKNTRKNTWITTLVLAFIILAAGSWFLYSNFRQKNIIQKQKNNLLKQQLLLTQMNPHFIFNSLNAIQNFIIKQNSLQAGIYLSQFAGMIRMILDFSRKDYISLESELNFLSHYMELQRLRTDQAFAYTVEVGEDIEPDMLLVPPMLAQPFIENAIEHGGFDHNRKGQIRIHFHREEELLVCVIDDNGIGLKASAEQKKHSGKQHESLATAITLERMETLYHDRMSACRLVIEDKKDRHPDVSGVKVTFVIPCKEA